MRVAALCSGGKDSMFALWLAMREGHEVTDLVFVEPGREDSWMFHHPNVHLSELLSACIGIPARRAEFWGGKDEEIPFLKSVLREIGVDGVVSGVISSSFQKSRIDLICGELGMRHIAPLWGRDPEEVISEEVESGIEFIIVGVSAEGLGRRWLGQRVGRAELVELLKLSRRFGINPCGEGGEYETLVLDAPFFRLRLKILEAETIWDGQRGMYIVRRSKLEERV